MEGNPTGWSDYIVKLEADLQASREERKIDREEFQLACEQIDKLEKELAASREETRRLREENAHLARIVEEWVSAFPPSPAPEREAE